MRTARDKVHSTGGFWLVIGALLLAAPLRLVVWFGVACAIHELGHVAAVWALGGRIASFRLTGVGLVLCPRRARLFSYREECILALAGPAASLLLALGAGLWGRWLGTEDAGLLAAVSLALGLFNLLPAGPLDGGRVFQAAVARRAGPDAGERWGKILTRVLAGLLLWGGLWVMGQSGNFTLLLCALWLLWRAACGGGNP